MQWHLMNPRRRAWRRVSVLTVAIAGLILTSPAFATVANASTGNQVVVSSIPNMRGCSIQLLATWDGRGNDYAAARGTYVFPPNFNPAEDVVGCEFALFRTHNGSTTQVSGTHDVYSGTQTTYNYWDGAGYLCSVGARQIYGDNDGVSGFGPWEFTGNW
jgi:hypothetical protein